MKPENLKTKIFLDSGDPKETKQALEILGFLDGQTTNPSLVAKHPDAVGKKFSREEILNFYKKTIQEISVLLPNGSVSVEVYADQNTSAEEMLDQAVEFSGWIKNAHIKYPTTKEGLKAAYESIKQGMRVNMTLVFTQQQAAAVYAATLGAKKGDVFVSPFIGRLDDIGLNGLDLIGNIVKMYALGDGHVEVLSASIRSLEHFVKAIETGSNIITAPLSAIKQWADAGMPQKISEIKFEDKNLKPIAYTQVDLNKDWQEYHLDHELTEKGLAKFAQDWNNLIK